MERKVQDSCGKSVSWGDPAGASRGGSPTARGKRVPGVEINVQILQPQKKLSANNYYLVLNKRVLSK
ncbi:hypothetical protein ACQKOM_02000 [Peribacillus frigoritolerans]|uniref:hypothetical protein n=1 Tax=Peribacillus frigoritolerans TaxID=450367 RepID=UPI003D014293